MIGKYWYQCDEAHKGRTTILTGSSLSPPFVDVSSGCAQASVATQSKVAMKTAMLAGKRPIVTQELLDTPAGLSLRSL